MVRVIALSPTFCCERRVAVAHGGTFQLGARFLPQLNAIAAGLAGATNVGITRFVCYGAVSALTWAGRGSGSDISSAMLSRGRLLT
jgi:hypothetical protein